MESVSLSYTVIRKVYIRTINQITGREQSNALNCIHFTYPVAGVPPIKLNPCLNAVAVDRICAFAVKLVTGLVTRNERIRVLLPICFESLSPLSFSLVKFHVVEIIIHGLQVSPPLASPSLDRIQIRFCCFRDVTRVNTRDSH